MTWANGIVVARYYWKPVYVTECALLILAGFIAGAMNALVGGGSFVTLPALLGTGLSSVEANASSAVALFPGGAVSAFVYRGGATRVCRVPLTPLMAASILGGGGGAALLLWTPTRVFDRVLPWLLLIATIALAFGPHLARLHGATSGRGRFSVVLVQFLLGIYAGYFGGAVGLLMIAAWRILGENDIKSLNGPRTLLVTLSNTSAIIVLIAVRLVRWTALFPVCAGALAGGYTGARLGNRLSPLIVRTMTIVVSISITLAFFLKAYLAG
jgi:uncharacterized membrane protein YfcA